MKIFLGLVLVACLGLVGCSECRQKCPACRCCDGCTCVKCTCCSGCHQTCCPGCKCPKCPVKISVTVP